MNNKLISTINKAVDILTALNRLLNDLDSDYKEFIGIDKVVDKLKNLNPELVSKLNAKLDKCGANITAYEFASRLNPSKSDMIKLVNDNFKFNGDSIDLYELGYSKEFIDNIIAYKPAKKSNTTAVGEYEIAAALLLGGSLNNNGGDISINGNNIEVKKVESDAVIGENGKTVSYLNAFDELLYKYVDTKFEGSREGYTLNGRGKAGNIEIQHKVLNRNIIPNILEEFVDGEEIKAIDLAYKIFDKVINMYTENVDYLLFCNKGKLTFIKVGDNLTNILKNSYTVSFKTNREVGRRFKIKSRIN